MSTLIFDIETVGEDYDELDEVTQDCLSRWIKRESMTRDEYEKRLEDLKDGLGFSPLTGEIIIIGVLDYEKNRGTVYFQAPEKKIEPFEENGFTFKSMTEKEMLESFWNGIKHYQSLVSFNGRRFDIPFLMLRSAVNKVKPSKNLLSNRYLNSQWQGVKHIDLLDQLTFYGALPKRPNLHLVTRAFGIKSPKIEGITGDDVKQLFLEGKYIELAKYNVGDLMATKEVYERWRDYLRI